MVEKRYSNDNRARERQKERKEQKGKKKKDGGVMWCGVIRQDKTKCVIVGDKIEVSDVTVYCALHIMALTLTSVLH